MRIFLYLAVSSLIFSCAKKAEEKLFFKSVHINDIEIADEGHLDLEVGG